MFWSRAKVQAKEDVPRPPARVEPTPESKGLDADAVMDTLGAVLRTLGKFSFDTEDARAEDVAKTFERWAEHVVIGGRHPEDAREGAARQGRDLLGLKRFVNEHRRREQSFVSNTVTELRKLVWTFVRSVHTAVAAETDADAKARQQLSRLHAATLSPSIEDLKREALAAVDTLDEILRERARRQSAQVTELGERLRAMGRQLEDVKRESELDPLTKVGNRRALDDRLARAVEMSLFCPTDQCLIMVDIDHFKSINDRHGHPVGDLVLVRVADALSRAFLRKSDFVGRFGGEEFAIIVPDTPLANTHRLTARLMDAVRNLSFEDVAPQLKVTVSVGVAALGAGESAQAWLERADRALYEAKNTGRNRAVEAPRASVERVATS